MIFSYHYLVSTSIHLVCCIARMLYSFHEQMYDFRQKTTFRSGSQCYHDFSNIFIDKEFCCCRVASKQTVSRIGRCYVMIQWDMPLLAMIRNLISMIGLVMLFLALDQPKYAWKKTIIAYILFVAIYTTLGSSWMLYSPISYVQWFTLTIYVGSALFFSRMSSDTFLQVIYNISVQMFVHTLQLVVGIAVSKAIFHANPWGEIVIMLLYQVIVVWIYLHLFRSPYRELVIALRDRWRNFSFVSIIGCVFLIIYWTRPTFLMARSLTDQLLYVCIWGLFLMTHFMMLKTMSSQYRELTVENKIALVEMNNRQLNIQLSMIQDSVEEARRIRHDMRHYNLLVAQYAEKGQIKELLQYVSDYVILNDTDDEPTYCDNVAANNILSAYVHKAKRQGIKVKLDVALEQEIAIHDLDLVAMLANLMENAIHGCINAKKPEPFIELYVGRKASKLVIYERNTAREDIQFENNMPKSEYGNGIGVSSIIRSAKRYGGEYDFSVDNGVFSCQLLLKVPKAIVK